MPRITKAVLEERLVYAKERLAILERRCEYQALLIGFYETHSAPGMHASMTIALERMSDSLAKITDNALKHKLDLLRRSS